MIFNAIIYKTGKIVTIHANTEEDARDILVDEVLDDGDEYDITCTGEE